MQDPTLGCIGQLAVTGRLMAVAASEARQAEASTRWTDWEPASGQHQGQRSGMPHTKAGQMTAPFQIKSSSQNTLAARGSPTDGSSIGIYIADCVASLNACLARPAASRTKLRSDPTTIVLIPRSSSH